MTSHHHHRRPRPARFTSSLFLMTVLLFAAAIFGGTARADTTSLILLRPLAIVLALVGIMRLTREQARDYRGPLLLLACFIAIVALHVVPLPTPIWSALPGREILTDIDRAARLGEVWRPLTLQRWGGYNALFALMVPAAVLLLAVGLDARGRLRVLGIIIAIGLFSAALGVFQFAGGPKAPLYFYRISNNGSSIGLLANRNHQGVFLGTLFPLIGAYAAVAFARDPRRRADGKIIGDVRRWSAAVIAAMVLPVVFATSSRAGVASAAIGISAAMLIAWPHYREASRAARAAVRTHHRGGIVTRPWFKTVLLSIAGLGFVGFAVVAVGLAQGNAVDRLLADSDAAPELRLPIWRATWHAVWQFFPFGSGAGSFVDTFQIYEPRELLTPLYINHAHNDYLELVLEFGVLAPALVVAGLAILLRDAWTVWRGEGMRASITIARGSSIALGQFALGSALDYPLRTPLLAAVAAALVVLLRAGALEVRKARVG